jgi:hypothetical protein
MANITRQDHSSESMVNIIRKGIFLALAAPSFIDLGGFDRYKIVYIGILNREKTAVNY